MTQSRTFGSGFLTAALFALKHSISSADKIGLVFFRPSDSIFQLNECRDFILESKNNMSLFETLNMSSFLILLAQGY